MIQNPARLSLSKGQLQLENDDGVTSLPLEDIGCIVLESPQITLSSALLGRCQDMGVCVVTCDDTHMPNGVLHPFMPHSRQSKVAKIQVSWSAALKKRIWQNIIKQKINAQAEVLEIFNEAPSAAKALRAMSKLVASGDPGNVEAQAARQYWGALFGASFRRHQGDIVNGALNYGYAILRATLARSVTSYGLLPAFGVHHDSDLNAFNLVDDLIEPYRSFVDRRVKLLVLEKGLSMEDRLTKEHRQALAELLKETCRFSDGHQSLLNAADRTAASLVSAIEKKDASKVEFPSMPDPLVASAC